MGVLRSIRLRLTLWYVLVLAVILAAFSTGIYLTLRHNLSENLDNSVENRTDILLDIVRYDEGRPTLAGLVSPVDPAVGEHFIRVYDDRGTVSFDSTAGTEDVPIIRREAVQASLVGRARIGTLEVGDEPMRVRTVPITRSQKISGVLEVGLSDDTGETLQSLLLILAVAYPVTLATASIGGVFLAGRALSPIAKITRLARRISADDLNQRLELALPEDEIGQLAHTFNDMIARLEAAFRRQRQFTADASHELRTPLTAVKGQIEVALSRRRDPDVYRDVLQAVNEEVDRLIRLVGSLLTLARADAGEIPVAAEPIDLRDLVSAAVEQVRTAAKERDVAIGLEGAGNVRLQADQDLLLQLVLNLLDNALKHTGRGGQVTVGWGADDGLAQLWVRDTGVGIAAEHLGRVFDRFYRVDKARSRSEGGAGLGLSISRWIVEAHGGRISVESSPGQGATFTVALPGASRRARG